MTTRLARWAPLSLLIPFVILYRYTGTAQFSYDGVLYALDIEYGATAQLFHPGHLLFSFLFRQLIIFLHLFGWSGRALFLMQSVNAWIAALAVGLLSVLLSDQFGWIRGTLFAAFFGLSPIFWSEAIDPGCYALAGLAAVCLLILLLDARERSAWQTGLLHGAVILFHQLFILAIPAFLVAIGFGNRPFWRRQFQYVIGVLLLPCVIYGYVALHFHPGAFSEKLKWFFIPTGTPLTQGVAQNCWWTWSLRVNIQSFWELLTQNFVSQTSGAATVIIGVLMALVVIQSIHHFNKRSRLWEELVASWIWVISMGIFLFYFRHAPRFQVLLLVPIVFIMASLSTGLRGRSWGIGSTVGLLLLATLNYTHAIAPQRSGGDQQARLLWIRDHVQSVDFLLFAGRGPHSIINVYMAYFLPQIPARSLYGHLLTQYGRSDASMDAIMNGCQEALHRGGHVWMEKDLLDPAIQQEAETQMHVPAGSVSRWFKKFKEVREIPGPGGYRLAEVTPAFQAR